MDIRQVCRLSYYHLKNISRIRNYVLTQKATETLVHALITTRLDYCNGHPPVAGPPERCNASVAVSTEALAGEDGNGLIYGLPHQVISQRRRVQNSAARLNMRARTFDHISPVL